MELKKSEKNLLIFLGLVVVAVGVYKFVIEPGSKAKEVAAGTSQKTTNVATGQVSADKKPVQISAHRLPVVKEKLFASWKRDPFYGKTVKTVATKAAIVRKKKVVKKIIAPVLKGILMNQSGAQAVIDDLILSEGQTKNGIHVVSIKSTEVVCTKNNRTFTLLWSKSR